jgi:hypothetical protein
MLRIPGLFVREARAADPEQEDRRIQADLSWMVLFSAIFLSSVGPTSRGRARAARYL